MDGTIDKLAGICVIKGPAKFISAALVRGNSACGRGFVKRCQGWFLLYV